MRWLSLLCLFVCAAASAAGPWPAPDIAGAMKDGNDAGSGVNQAKAQAGVNATTGAAIMPGYGTTAPETSYFSGGAGILGPYSSSKKSDCATTPAATAALQGQCDAINQMAKQTGPGGKPPISITPSDPLLTAGRPVQADPSTVIGTVSSTYSACTTKTVTNPGDFVLEQCSDWLSASSMSCAVGELIKLDPHYVYQCQESLATAASNSCFVPRVVLVDATYHYQCQTTGRTPSTPVCTRRAIVTVSGGGNENLPAPTALGSVVVPGTPSVKCDAWNVSPTKKVRLYCVTSDGPFDLDPGQSATGHFSVPSGKLTYYYDLTMSIHGCDGTNCTLRLVQSWTSTGAFIRAVEGTILDPTSVPSVAPLASMAALAPVAGAGAPAATAFADGTGTGYYVFALAPTFVYQTYYLAHLTTGGTKVAIGGVPSGRGRTLWYGFADACAAGTCIIHYPDYGDHRFSVPQPYITSPYRFDVTWDNSECETYAARRP